MLINSLLINSNVEYHYSKLDSMDFSGVRVGDEIEQ
jgi:hypothetical protein